MGAQVIVFALCLLMVHLGGTSFGENASQISATVPKLAPPNFSPEKEEQLVSVTVRLSCATPVEVVYYTLDKSTPDLTSLSATSGVSILIDSSGENVVSAFCFLSNSSTSNSVSPIVSKKYIVLPRCKQPVIFPHGGTFAGSVSVSVASDTPGASIIYTLDNSPPVEGRSQVLLPGSPALVLTASATLSAVALKPHFAASAVSKQTFFITPKAATPQIQPAQTVFAVSATLTITCTTPNATIFYTTDGTSPTQSSYRLDPLSPQLVLDAPGSHIVSALAWEQNMLQSDIAVKQLSIMPRAASPELLPPPGTYVSRVSVCFSCPSAAPADSPTANTSSGLAAAATTAGTVYYTLDGRSTPSLQSQHLLCGSCLALSQPSAVHLRAFVSEEGKSPSSIVTALYTIARPAYDTHPVNPNATLQMRPDVQVFVVEKNLDKSYCGKRNVRGRLVVLHNPIGHFDVLEPARGCSGGLALPSVSGRMPWSHPPATAASPAAATATPQYSAHYSRAQVAALTPEDVSVWEDEYSETNAALGCEVVTNAGFFNVTNEACLGDVVSAGRVVQTSHKHNVNFGIRDGQFVTGYVTSDEIIGVDVLSATPVVPFDTLVSGLGWLVRGGEVYVDESFRGRTPPAVPSKDDADSPSLSSSYGEDMSPQTSGDQFPTLLSARTALGHDAQGRLLLLQVEGESWVRGMSLREFAAFARDLGFLSAINLDGGGSATMTVNHSLVSEPSWACTPEDYASGGAAPFVPLDATYCEKRVSTVTCIHSMPPPLMNNQQQQQQQQQPQKDSSKGHSKKKKSNDTDKRPDDSLPESLSTQPPAPAPVAAPPTAGATSSPTSSSSSRTQLLESQLREARASESLFQALAAALGLLLTASLLVHVGMCVKGADRSGAPPASPSFQWHGAGGEAESGHLESRERDVEMGHARRPATASSPNQLTGGGGGSSNQHDSRRLPPGQQARAVSPGKKSHADEDEDDMALENYGLPDALDFNDFDDSDDDDVADLKFHKPSSTSQTNRSRRVEDEEDRESRAPAVLMEEEEEEEEEEMDIEAEEQKSLLSPPSRRRSPPPSPPSAESHSRRQKKRDKKSRADKKGGSKRMAMVFSDRTL